MEGSKSTELTKSESNAIVPKDFNNQLKFFEEIAKGANTGVKTTGDAMLLYQKAKELGIGWGNAIPHMHIINGKSGIDIHIIKAILTKPKSGVTWIKTEDYVGIYNYVDPNSVIYAESELPPNYIVVNSFKDEVPEGRHKVAILPTNIGTAAAPVWKKLPVDFRTTYIFTRKKKDIDDTWITTTATGTFSWSKAITAGLPIDKQGNLNPDGVWQKYRQLMIDTRAFTLGSRDIASDLLMGNYEKTELLDFNNVNYTVEESNGEIGKVTILDAKGQPIKNKE
jgi:hypothetical protein